MDLSKAVMMGLLEAQGELDLDLEVRMALEGIQMDPEAHQMVLEEIQEGLEVRMVLEAVLTAQRRLAPIIERDTRQDLMAIQWARYWKNFRAW